VLLWFSGLGGDDGMEEGIAALHDVASLWVLWPRSSRGRFKLIAVAAHYYM
jgi:hypothetical protein